MKYGYWNVTKNGIAQPFDRKIDALLAAGEDGQIQFIYNDPVWDSFDRSTIGKVDLDTLYRERALQLRAKYKTLKLYYSGGADSTNILMTFINNGIKLDEIVVKWPKKLVDGSFYTPNSDDFSAYNYWSEWDLAVQPRLEWLKEHHPEIKVTLLDYTDNLTEKTVVKTLHSVNFNSIVMVHALPGLAPDGDTTGYIFGVDKPYIYLDNGKIYMFFSDLGMTLLSTSTEEDFKNENKECFYWAPDFPILPFEMAYRTSQLIKKSPGITKVLFGNFNLKGVQDFHNKQFQLHQLAVKKACYTTWDDRFQADKPIYHSRYDKFSWFMDPSIPELDRVRQVYLSESQSIANSLPSRFLLTDRIETGDSTLVLNTFKTFVTKPFFVCDF